MKLRTGSNVVPARVDQCRFGNVLSLLLDWLATGEDQIFDLAGIQIEALFHLLKKIRLEIAINEDFVKPTVDAIVKGAKTGTIGDDKIFVTALDECVRIRTGETGEDAL